LNQLVSVKSQHPPPPPPRAGAGTTLELPDLVTTWSRRRRRRSQVMHRDQAIATHTQATPENAESTHGRRNATMGELLNAVPQAPRRLVSDNLYYVNFWGELQISTAFMGRNSTPESGLFFRGGVPASVLVIHKLRSCTSLDLARGDGVPGAGSRTGKGPFQNRSDRQNERVLPLRNLASYTRGLIENWTVKCLLSIFYWLVPFGCSAGWERRSL